MKRFILGVAIALAFTVCAPIRPSGYGLQLKAPEAQAMSMQRRAMSMQK